MSGIFYLALRHIRYHALRSLTFVLVVATLITIPLLGRLLTHAAEVRMLSRAEATPLVYGAKGSALELVLAGAYFRGSLEVNATMADYRWLLSTKLAQLAPIHWAGSSATYPIIGTDIEYLSLRSLEVAEGRKPVRVGEVVLGAEVATALRLGVGDEILSDAEQAFDLAGAYPVGMTVSGILAHSNSPDDGAILTDLKTSWIVAGFGHGHEDLSTAVQSSILKQSEDLVTANASLPTHIQITSDNLDSFHLHGSDETQLLTAVLVFPDDVKAAALIQGRVADQRLSHQIIRPIQPIGGLLENVFAVKKVLDRVIVALSVAALFALGLILALSVQMRSREFDIAQRLGGRKGLPALLVLGELSLLCLAALAVSAALVGVVQSAGTEVINAWLLEVVQ